MCRVNVVRLVPWDGMSPSDEDILLFAISRYNIAFAARCRICNLQIDDAVSLCPVLFGKGSNMKKRESLDHVRLMVLSAMLTALSVLLTRVVSIQIGEAMRFGFGTIPIILAGIIAGPVYGFAVGVAADIIGSLINLMGQSFIIGVTFCSGLMGAVPALIYRIIFKKKNIYTLSVAIAASELLISGVLKSWFLWIMYGGSFVAVWLGPKLITAAIMAVIEIILTGVLLRVLSRTSFTKSFLQ